MAVCSDPCSLAVYVHPRHVIISPSSNSSAYGLVRYTVILNTAFLSDPYSNWIAVNLSTIFSSGNNFNSYELFTSRHTKTPKVLGSVEL
jgi:hypothetical protein